MSAGDELRGTGVSAGIAVGPALIVERDVAPTFRLPLLPEQVEGEVVRLGRALDAARSQLLAIKERLSREVGVPHAYIFDAHLLMLDDPLLRDRAVAVIRADRVNAEWALRVVSDQLHALFGEFSDAYLKERSTDLDDVLGRIMLNLSGGADAPRLSRLPGSFVLVAEGLRPSEAAELDWDRVLALATDVGSATYHTAIIARSLGIPAVVGLKDATKKIPPGALIAVDGTRGLVVIEPSGTRLVAIRAEQARDEQDEERLRDGRVLPAVTLDGATVRLLANVEFSEEAATARLYGAEGIGLFRSEYLLGRARKWPTEEHQVDVYRRLLEQMAPYPVTVRTWDVGAEEMAPGGPSSANPALGERALRLARRFPEVFKTQLRALLRARAYGPLRVMFPLASGPADIELALALAEEAGQELRAEGVPFGEDLPLGATIEVPSAALTADLLARRVEFFSIGTNDLIQYLLAADRADPRVAAFYQPLHPAVLRTVRQVVRAAEAAALPVGVCGEMASTPLLAVLLLGFGVRELSMAPAAIPRVRAAIRAVEVAAAERVALACLDLQSDAEVDTLLRRELASVASALSSA